MEVEWEMWRIGAFKIVSFMTNFTDFAK